MGARAIAPYRTQYLRGRLVTHCTLLRVWIVKHFDSGPFEPWWAQIGPARELASVACEECPES